MKENGEHQRELERLVAKTRFFMFLSVFSIAAAIATAVLFCIFQKQDDVFYGKTKYSPPYYKEVTRIMRDVHYSGVEMLLRPDVNLILDTEKKTWILRNAYSFNEQGQVLLEKGKYGICGELASYTADRIRPLLGDEYSIKFVRAAYSAYFLGDYASHIVLKIYHKNFLRSGEVYVIDPSFKKYGAISDFEDYFFYEESNQPEFIRQKDKNFILPVNHGIPLLIKDGYLVGLAVESVANTFDMNNFSVALTATRKYRYAGRYMFAIRRYYGEEQFQGNEILAKGILREKEYNILKNKVTELFKNAQKRAAH